MNFLVLLVAFVLAATVSADDELPLVLVAKSGDQYYPLTVRPKFPPKEVRFPFRRCEKYDVPIEFIVKDENMLFSTNCFENGYVGFSKGNMYITTKEDEKTSFKFDEQNKLISHRLMTCGFRQYVFLRDADTDTYGCEDVEIYLLGFDKKDRTIQRFDDKNGRLETFLTVHESNTLVLFTKFRGTWYSITSALTPGQENYIQYNSTLHYPIEFHYEGDALITEDKRWFACLNSFSAVTIQNQACLKQLPRDTKKVSSGVMYVCGKNTILFPYSTPVDMCESSDIYLFEYDRKTDSPRWNGYVEGEDNGVGKDDGKDGKGDEDGKNQENGGNDGKDGKGDGKDGKGDGKDGKGDGKDGKGDEDGKNQENGGNDGKDGKGDEDGKNQENGGNDGKDGNDDGKNGKGDGKDGKNQENGGNDGKDGNDDGNDGKGDGKDTKGDGKDTKGDGKDGKNQENGGNDGKDGNVNNGGNNIGGKEQVQNPQNTGVHSDPPKKFPWVFLVKSENSLIPLAGKFYKNHIIQFVYDPAKEYPEFDYVDGVAKLINVPTPGFVMLDEGNSLVGRTDNPTVFNVDKNGIVDLEFYLCGLKSDRERPLFTKLPKSGNKNCAKEPVYFMPYDKVTRSVPAGWQKQLPNVTYVREQSKPATSPVTKPSVEESTGGTGHKPTSVEAENPMDIPEEPVDSPSAEPGSENTEKKLEAASGAESGVVAQVSNPKVWSKVSHNPGPKIEVPGTNIQNSGMEVGASDSDTKGTENKFGASENTKDFVSKSGTSDTKINNTEKKPGVSGSNTNVLVPAAEKSEKKLRASESNTNVSEPETEKSGSKLDSSESKKVSLKDLKVSSELGSKPKNMDKSKMLVPGASKAQAITEDTKICTTHCTKKNNFLDTFNGNTLNGNTFNRNTWSRNEALQAMKQNSTTSTEATPTAKICNKCHSGSQTTVWKTYTDYTTYCPQSTTVTITVCDKKCVPSTKTVPAAATLIVTGKCIVPEITTIEEIAKERPEAERRLGAVNPEQKVKEKEVHGQKEASKPNLPRASGPSQPKPTSPSQLKTSDLKADNPTGADTSESGNSGTSGNGKKAGASQKTGTNSLPKPRVAPSINAASKNALGVYIGGFAALLL